MKEEETIMKVRTLYNFNLGRRKNGLRPFANAADLFRLRRALIEVVRAVGERMRKGEAGAWEGLSLSGDHHWSRNDLEALGLIYRYIQDFFARYGIKADVSFETEEGCFIAIEVANGCRLRLIIDPIDGTKACDNWKAGGDCPLPAPGSAVSIAAVCPVVGEIVASAVYCFDLGEVFSSVYLGPDEVGRPQYASFRNETVLPRLGMLEENAISAKRRVLCGDYNSKALVELARLKLALMEKGLNPTFGGLTGSSATDMINVVRGSFCVCLDCRALCGKGGSVPYWYDIAGSEPVARGRGLTVFVTDSEGKALSGGDHEIRTPVGFVVARPGLEDIVVEAIRATVCPQFLVAAPEALEVVGAVA
jgi:fructose-1,6-bisphosphatase/inositol monophosphatase family enzyme